MNVLEMVLMSFDLFIQLILSCENIILVIDQDER